MQLIKWTLMAAVGCLPALALAEEPAKKPDKAGEEPKIGLRIEVQTEDGKPHVIVLGDGDGKEAKEGAKEAKELARQLEVLVKKAEREARPNPAQAQLKAPGTILLREAPEGKEGERYQFTINAPFHHERKKGGYLGIATDAPPPVLRNHLGLHDGFGLVIDEVMHESPAAKAGLKKFDVLQKVDDQLVINFEQLSVLIHSHKAGDEVKLAIIHEGKPQVISAKLGEHEYEGLGERREFEEVKGVIGQLLPHPGAGWQRVPEARSQGGGILLPGAQLNPRPLGGGVTGQPRPTSKTIKEGDHTYTLTVSPWGQRTFVVSEKNKEIFNGAVNTKEQREKVPANLMDTLQKLEKEVMPQIINKPLPPGASSPQIPAPNATPNPAPKKKAEKDSDAK